MSTIKSQTEDSEDKTRKAESRGARQMIVCSRTWEKSGSYFNNDLHVAEVQREGKEKQMKKKELSNRPQIQDRMKQRGENKQHPSHRRCSKTFWLLRSGPGSSPWMVHHGAPPSVLSEAAAAPERHRNVLSYCPSLTKSTPGTWNLECWPAENVWKNKKRINESEKQVRV